jgi:uncharacterized protein YjeT (DUF2065 family)
MTDHQVLQLFGVTFIVIGASMLKNPESIKKILDEIEHSNVSLFLSGLISLVIGCLLVVLHNVWEISSSLIITLIGWSGLLKGISILIFPEFTLRLSRRIVSSNKLNYFAWASVVLGVVSLYLGIL